jgi:hypothetical protein
MRTSAFLLFLSFLSTVLCVGSPPKRNCDGSVLCGLANSNVAQKLVNFIQYIDQSRWYEDGEQIACVRESQGNAENGAIWYALSS